MLWMCLKARIPGNSSEFPRPSSFPFVKKKSVAFLWALLFSKLQIKYYMKTMCLAVRRFTKPSKSICKRLQDTRFLDISEKKTSASPISQKMVEIIFGDKNRRRHSQNCNKISGLDAADVLPFTKMFDRVSKVDFFSFICLLYQFQAKCVIFCFLYFYLQTSYDILASDLNVL